MFGKGEFKVQCTKWICMCNQNYGEEKGLRKLLRDGQNTSEIIPKFHKYTIWLPINIVGDELR